ncbi:hypothetical protein LGQ02_15155 [Bacillus shivajii]|uniref:hypothetical protein n=1 Tax=Bacillus shivajii TaxID=1983719 RepID=UPI001CFA7864|nr:hypothetical protein [Bacillus shivajii]UCZ52173.1 hypothetical protein LGQ02_15155 [Bacillus shivajii]
MLKMVYDHFFFHWYFNDIFAGMMILALSNLFILIGKQFRLYMFTFKVMMLVTFMVGLFWEYITPLYLRSSVTDPIDIIAYMFGGGLYWLTMKYVMKK